MQLGSDVTQAGPSVIKSADVVRPIDVRDHVIRTTEACSFHLRRLRSVRQLLGRDVAIQLVVALVFLHLD